MKRILALSIALLLGVTIGAFGRPLLETGTTPLARSGSTEFGSPTKNAVTQSARTQPTTDGPTKVTSAEEPEHSPAPSHGSSRPESAEDLISRALNALPKPKPAPSGQGSIRGHIHRPDGTPVTGVAIYMNPRSPDHGAESSTVWAEQPFTKRVKTLLTGLLEGEAERLTAVTGEDGTFEFKGLASLSFWVQAKIPGHVLNRVNSRSSDWQDACPGEFLDLVASPAVLVTVDVRLPDGRQPIRALVTQRVDAKAGDDWQTWAPPGYTFECSPGVIRFSAEVITLEGPDFTVPNESVVTIGPDSAASIVTLQLSEVPCVKGRLVFRGPPRKLDIRLCQVSGGQTLQADAIKTLGVKSEWDRWDADKHAAPLDYRFASLSTGQFVLAAVEFGKVIAQQTVRVSDRTVRVDLEIPDAAPEHAVRLRLLGPDGKPVPGPLFQVWGYSGFWDATGVSLDGGEWLVVPSDFARKMADGGPWFLVKLSADGLGTKIRLLKEGAAGVETVTMDSPASLDVSFNGTANAMGQGGVEFRLDSLEPLRPALAVGGESDAPSTVRGGGTTVEKENLVRGGERDLSAKRYERLSPGKYRVSLSCPREDERERVGVWSQEVTLAAGENQLSVPVPRVSTLVIRFAAELQGSVVGITKTGGESLGRWEVGDGGKLAVPGLAEGEYLVCLRPEAEEPNWMPIRLPATGEFAFSGVTGNALRITLGGDDTEGISERTGLRAGDVILSCNGRRMGSRAESLAMLGVGGGGTLMLEIERSERRIVVHVPAEALRSALESGHVNAGPDYR